MCLQSCPGWLKCLPIGCVWSFFVDVLSVVLNAVVKSPSSFTDVKEIWTQPTLNLVNHILGQACHVAVDLPCFSNDSVCMGGMAS